MVRAVYTHRVIDGVHYVVDLDQGMSVTNDAEAVVEAVLATDPRPTKGRIVYRDTDGRWDELVHDGKKFTGFAPIPNGDLVLAYCK